MTMDINSGTGKDLTWAFIRANLQSSVSIYSMQTSRRQSGGASPVLRRVLKAETHLCLSGFQGLGGGRRAVLTSRELRFDFLGGALAETVLRKCPGFCFPF